MPEHSNQKRITLAFDRMKSQKERREKIYGALCKLAGDSQNSLNNQAMELLEIGIEAIEKQKGAANLAVVMNNHELDIPKIKGLLYDILETGNTDVKAEQFQDISLTKSLAHDRHINIFQMQSLTFTQVAVKISQILRLLDRSTTADVEVP